MKTLLTAIAALSAIKARPVAAVAPPSWSAFCLEGSFNFTHFHAHRASVLPP
jgi:hypothetical protein